MAEIGIRELRDHLSRYLDQVKAGEEIVVTDRGTAVARLVPVNGERPIDRLIREGRITPAKRPKRGSLPKPIKPRTGKSISELLVDDRR